MKKQLVRHMAWILVTLMLAGCAEANPATTGQEPAASAEEEAGEETAAENEDDDTIEDVSNSGELAEAENTEEDEETTVAEETDERVPLQAMIYRWSKRKWNEDARPYEEQVSVSYDAVQLAEVCAESYPELARTLSDIKQERIREGEKAFTSMVEEIENLQEEEVEIPWAGALTEVRELMVHRADEKVFSVTEQGYSYGGGVHGYYWTTGMSFDVKTGKEIPLSDLVTDDDRLREALYEELTKAYPNTYWLMELKEALEVYDIVPPEYDLEEEVDYDNYHTGYDWVLSPQGVTFFFNPYALASYADGQQVVTIPFEGYPGLFSEIYGEAKEFAMNFGGMTKADVDRDGETEEIAVYGIMGEYGNIDEVQVIIKEETYGYAMEDMVYAIHPVLLGTASGKTWLYLMTDIESDYGMGMIFDLSEGEPVYIGRVEGGVFMGSTSGDLYDEDGYYFAQITEGSRFFLEERSDLLGTMSAIRPFRVGENGMPETDQAWYDLPDGRGLTLLREESFAVVEKERDDYIPQEEEKKLQPGDAVQVLRTDRKTYVDVLCEDGTEVRIPVETKDGAWPQKVGGEDIEEVFDGLLFAG